MKTAASLMAAVALGILAGCASSKQLYQSNVTLAPAPDAGQYDISFLITDISDPANPGVLSTPTLRLAKGKEGRLSVGDETEGITCTALVDDDSGEPKAETTVTMKKDGKVVWTEKKTVGISK